MDKHLFVRGGNSGERHLVRTGGVRKASGKREEHCGGMTSTNPERLPTPCLDLKGQRPRDGGPGALYPRAGTLSLSQ